VIAFDVEPCTFVNSAVMHLGIPGERHAVCGARSSSFVLVRAGELGAWRPLRCGRCSRWWPETYWQGYL